jgi:hypothetical protein
MLRCLASGVSERKVRLFAVACCRVIGDAIHSAKGRRAVEVAELHADGLVTDGQRQKAHAAVRRFRMAGELAARASAGHVRCVGWLTVRYAVIAARLLRHQHPARTQCDLLREIVGNPWRPVAVEPVWLSWNGGAVPMLAQGIYDERAFDRLPILADALEDAGCSDRDILDHCRGPGPHVRGCWAVDLLLGKE